MEMTFDQYIQNPMGIKNSVISKREIYRTMYIAKLDNILVREAGKIDYILYKKNDDIYYAYLKIPSEVIDKFYYDVVVEFISPNNKSKNDSTLRNYNIKFYSNDPAFVFTFAHSFIKNKIFISDLEDKMSKEAIKKRAVEKNPTNQVGYVKSLYFAYLIMSKRRLFDKNKYINKFDIKYLKNNIMYASDKIEQRQQAQEDLNIKRKKTQTKFRNDIARAVDVPGNNIIKRVKNTRTINSKKSSNNIKYTRKSKKI